MATLFDIPFASLGDKVTIPKPADPSGAISYSQGWPADYELPDSDPAYRPVDRPEMNGLMFEITEAIGELQRGGAAPWGAAMAPYPNGAEVLHAGQRWVSTVAGNNDTPGTSASWKSASSSVPVGTLIAVTGSFDAGLHSDYLLVPTAPTTLSRAAYPELFAYWGTRYGIGDGITTFGMMYLPQDYVPVQAGANAIGSVSPGVVRDHAHTITLPVTGNVGSSGSGTRWNAPTDLFGTATATTDAMASAPANLAAGVRVLYLVKFR